MRRGQYRASRRAARGRWRGARFSVVRWCCCCCCCCCWRRSRDFNRESPRDRVCGTPGISMMVSPPSQSSESWLCRLSPCPCVRCPIGEATFGVRGGRSAMCPSPFSKRGENYATFVFFWNWGWGREMWGGGLGQNMNLVEPPSAPPPDKAQPRWTQKNHLLSPWQDTMHAPTMQSYIHFEVYK